MPVSRCLAAALACLWLALAGCAGPVAPDLVITNARVFTNDPARPWAEAVAMKGQRVVAIGTAGEALAGRGPATRVVDAAGRVVVPGFNDARVDLPLDPPTPAALAALDRAAIMRGVTSLQVVAGGPMRSLVVAAQQATRQARWRLIRSPMDGERPQDEEPYLPPQPGERLFASGVSWTLGPWWAGRRSAEPQRLNTILQWAYGAEDPVVVALRGDLSEGGVGEVSGGEELRSYLTALRGIGVTEVWHRKRPRLDLYGRVPLDPRAGSSGGAPISNVLALLDEIRKAGVVVTVVPRVPADRHFEKDTADFAEPFEYERAGVRVALGSGSGGGRSLIAALADVRDIGDRSREATVTAATLGGAYAEKRERDKGWLGPGTLADLAVLSDDIFTAPDFRLDAITSLLTVVGGTIVYDAGVLPQ